MKEWMGGKMTWLKIMHSIGLTNLSDEQVNRYERMRKVRHAIAEFHSYESHELPHIDDDSLDLMVSSLAGCIKAPPDFLAKVLTRMSDI